MARPEVHPQTDGAGEDAPAGSEQGAIPPGTGVVRPTDVVRPGGVTRPGTGVVAPGGAAAKASAAVPDAPEAPLEPIHIVLPVIPVKPVKQGFFDRLVAPRPKKKKKDEDESPEPAVEESEEASAADVADPARLAAGPAAPAETRPPDTRPAEPRPAEQRPAEARPVEARPVETRPAEARPVEAWPVEAPPAPTRPAGRPRTAPPIPDREAPPQRPAPARPGRGTRPAPAEFYPDQRTRGPLPRRPAGRPGEWPEERPVRRGRWLAAATAVLVVSLGGGAAASQLAPAPPARWLPAALSGVAAPALTGLNTEAPRVTPAGIATRIQALLADPSFGGNVTASVVDVATGAPVFDLGGALPAIPASTAKLLTAAAVLKARGPAYRITTRVVAGSAPGEVIIVGGGDPTLAAGPTGSYADAARLDLLANQVKATLNGVAPTQVVVDSSLFVGPSYSPSWLVQDLKDGFIANITALMTDGARRNAKQIKSPAPRQDQPDLAAGQQFARLLGLPASAVRLGPGAARTDSPELGAVQSPPVARLVEDMLAESDNIVAEALARQVALAQNQPASFDGAAAATIQVLGQLGLDVNATTLVDGSGLSHQNRVSVQLLTSVLVHAADPELPELRSILSGLPVAAYSGTLADRYRSTNNGAAAAGVVRAKTGTLGGFHVSALAGLAVDADGRLLAFSIVTNGAANTLAAQFALDRVAAAIAACGCS
ncbi:MAG: D-alanyl-D-alanine carboxypeptidase/D-alanyl-D-alanine-endopeptidase [Micromonosporaceae bacterium]